MIVVDANTIIYLVRESPLTSLAREVYARDSDWVVPHLWEAEVLNGLMREKRAGRIGMEDAVLAASNAAGLLSHKVRACDRTAVLRTAGESGLTAYDAYYVTLARSLSVVLVTEDGRIKKNCPDVARSLKGFLGLPEEPSVAREAKAAYRTRRGK
jgi:predicted nucleic acid-binding protein